MKLTKWMPLFAVMAALLLVGDAAWAADGDNGRGFIGLGAGLAIGLAVLGGGLGQSNAARAAYESIARNPQANDKIFTPFILGMALIESLVLLGFVIAFLLQGQLG